MAVTISSVEDARALEGQEVGVSDWVLIDQERIDRFAEATDDHQWIHVDRARAERELPIGSTIAHGYLLVSLMPALVTQFMHFAGLERAINYGLNKVRFKNMVPAGSRVRLRARVLSARKRAGALQMVLENTIEIEGQSRPACVAETIGMYFFSSD
ncbi:MAG: MaoC family dehydratase [Gammaproteobacteria bacterium]|nr:MAG: MaoC family dehydratase [Gammaproteobacteria bacterium]